MSALSISRLAPESWRRGEPASLSVALQLPDAIAFAVDLVLEVFTEHGERVFLRHAHDDGAQASWLPAGCWLFEWTTGALALPSGPVLLRATASAEVSRIRHTLAVCEQTLNVAAGSDAASPGRISLRAAPGQTPSLDELSWRRGHSDWFFRHFDHAGPVVTSYMLGDSPMLKGRILDVGCGDGITDLSIALREQPTELVGIDPFGGYARLLEVARENHLSLDALPSNLRFVNADANHLPFPDDSFDVVISWGSVEHIAGGYLQALREIKRVLKPDGLLFIHPGLYYSNFGHHLGEFSSEPFFHLTKSHAELEKLVLESEPARMDRAGHVATPAEYWQWFNELNPITVSGFEAQLRTLEFDFYRAALRCEDRIEYTHAALQDYSMIDLSVAELYLSCINRKRVATPRD